jgi:hypothetical protein
MAGRDTAIREEIRRYIDGELSAAQLADWLLDEAWDLGIEAAAERRLAHDAGRLLDEWQNGDWTESELKGRLGALNRVYWFENAPKFVFFDSDSVFIREDRRSVATDRSPVAESA